MLHLSQQDGETADTAKTALAPTKLWCFLMKSNKDIFVFCLPPLSWVHYFSLKSWYCPRQNAQIRWPAEFKYVFKCCSSNPSSVFHPELPVIPKPGEFKRLFIWKKTAYETQRKANNNFFTWQHAFYFSIWDFKTNYNLAFELWSKNCSWVNKHSTWVNADSAFFWKSCNAQVCKMNNQVH